MAVHLSWSGNIKGVKNFKDEDFLKIAKLATVKDFGSKKKKFDFIELNIDPSRVSGTAHRYVIFQKVDLRLSVGRSGQYDYSITSDTDRYGNPNISSSVFTPNNININTCYIADTDFNRMKLVELLAGDLRIEGKDVYFNCGEIRVADEEFAKSELLADVKKLYESRKKEHEEMMAEAYSIAETDHANVIAAFKNTFGFKEGDLGYRDLGEYKTSVLPTVKAELKKIKNRKYQEYLENLEAQGR